MRALRQLIEATAHAEDLRWLWAAAQKERGNGLSELPSEDPEQNLEDVIAAYTAALRFYSPTIFPTEYATVQHNLGAAYLHQLRRSPEDNFERAIEAFTAALTIRTREADPYGWARTQNNLGNAYSARVRGERIENQRLAIEAYMAALEVHRIEEYPLDFSMNKLNLALAYQEFTGGQKTKNLDLAIASFLCALVVPGTKGSYQRIVLSLSDALRDRMELTPAGMRGSVAAALNPAVEILTEAVIWHAAPDEIRELVSDLTQIEAGAVSAVAVSWMPDADLFAEFRRARYVAMPLDELVAMVSSAEAQADTPHFIEMLRAVLDRPDVVLPSFRSLFWDELGLALMTPSSGDVAADREEAISSFDSALAGLNRKEHRLQWAAVQNHLAAAYGGRIAGDRAEN
jgi:tetratricopeptide (TPR) repeat protein